MNLCAVRDWPWRAARGGRGAGGSSRLRPGPRRSIGTRDGGWVNVCVDRSRSNVRVGSRSSPSIRAGRQGRKKRDEMVREQKGGWKGYRRRGGERPSAMRSALPNRLTRERGPVDGPPGRAVSFYDVSALYHELRTHIRLQHSWCLGAAKHAHGVRCGGSTTASSRSRSRRWRARGNCGQ